MTVYAGTYTFTREQLADLLDETVDEVAHRYRQAKAYDGKASAKRQRPGILACVIEETLLALDFDATRPAPPENGAPGASAEGGLLWTVAAAPRAPRAAERPSTRERR